MAVAKRILVYIVVACLTVSVAVPTVSATSMDSNFGTQDFVSLFSQTDEYYVKNSSMAAEELQNNHRVWVNNYGYIKWSVPRDIFAFDIFFTVQVPNSANFDESMVYLEVNGQRKSLGFVGLAGNEFQFRAAHYDNVYDIKIGVGSASDPVAFSGNFTVTDIYTTQLNAQPIYMLQRAELSGLCASKVDGSLYTSTFAQSDPNAADPYLPYSLEKKLNGQEDWGLISCDFEFDIFSNYSGSAYNDYFVFHVKTCGSITSVGACLLGDSSEDTEWNYYLLADDQLQTYMANGETDYFGSSSMRWPYYYYIIVVDTRGVEMQWSTLRVNISIDPVQISNTNKTQTGVYCEILRALGFPTRVGEPWYSNILGGIKNGFQSIVDKLDEVFNGDTESESAADALDQADDELSNITPEINAGQVIDDYHIEIEDLKTDNGFVHAAMLVGGFWQMVPWEYLLYVCLFGLAGYLIFGKR